MTLPQISLVIGDRELTRSHDGLTFSNVDPGGYEMLTARPADLEGIRAGATVVARCGMDTVFWGRVNEPGQKQTGQRQDYNVGALGAGDLLKRERIQELWIERDLSKWAGPSVARRLTVLASTFVEQGFELVPGSTPALALVVTDTWAAGIIPIAHATYDAQGVTIAELRGSWATADTLSFADPSWKLAVGLATDNTILVATESADLQPSGATGNAVLTASGKAYAYTYMHYVTGPAGTVGAKYSLQWSNLRLFGAHGLTVRGGTAATEGFYPDDIAWDAVSRAGAGIVRGRVDQASGYTVLSYTQLTPVAHEKVTLDMAQLMGWHTGVWEPQGFLSESPAWYFHAPPTSYTASVDRRDCLDIDIPRVRLDQLYDTAKVAWRDPAGTAGVQTVTLANPYLSEVGLSGQVLDLDLGVGSAAAATAYGTFALNLALSSARGAGSATMPMFVRNAAGVAMPACLLKSGRDRLRVTGLPDGGPWTSRDTRSFDTFRIKRVETTVSPDGIPRTRVEFDGGADLMEVLNARAAQARALIGQ